MLTALAHRALLKLPPHLAHRLALKAMALGWPVPRREPLPGPVTVAGLGFRNPIGIAAGFDKNAVALAGLARIGVGHVEVGTVTPRPQTANPGRTLVRLPRDRAIVNRMGMPNDGAEAVAARLARWRAANPDSHLRIGVSVGANRDCEDVAADLAAGISTLGPYADYLALNVSSPNTAGLRDWQAGDRLARALDTGAGARAQLPTAVPLFLKIAPDLGEDDEATLVDRAVGAGLDGLIVCNTTIQRPPGRRDLDMPGGLSGAPLTDRALAQLRRVRALSGGRLTLIASGGVMTADDVTARLAVGASLVQLMTGWVYGGPRLFEDLGQALAAPAGATPDRQLSTALR